MKEMIMTAVRKEAIRVLAEIVEVAPEVRLGQIVANLSYMARGLTTESIWDMEDDELLDAAQKHLEQLRSRQHSAV